MKKTIVYSKVGVTLIGGGRAKRGQISRSLEFAPFLVAADKGALLALKHGFLPDVVIGDLDSLSTLTPEIPQERIHHVPEQDTTDFEKCLYSIKARYIIALGVTGSRLDHSLAALNALTKCNDKVVLVVSGKDVAFVCPTDFTIQLPVGTRVSLFPMAGVKGQGEGLEWPIDDIGFSPLGPVSISNRTSEPELRLNFQSRSMLVILPARHLKAVLQAHSINRPVH